MTRTVYTETQFEANYPDGMENYYWTLARNNIIFHEIKKHKLDKHKILEIGCAKGLVLEYLRKNDINAWGSELGDPKPIEAIKDYVFINQDTRKLPIEFRNSINTILLLDVIEHIENPKSFLIDILENYPNIKNMIITVPARQELWSSYDVKYGHFRRYDLISLNNTINDISLTTQTISYFFKLLYIPGLILAKIFGERNHKITPPKSKFKIFIHFILSKLLFLEYIITPANIYGSSIICVLKKSNERR